MHTKRKGRIGELRFAAVLLEKGYDVYQAMTEELATDLIIDRDGKLERVQVKYVTPHDGRLKIPLRSSTVKYKKSYRDTNVDLIGVYDPVNDKGYLVPVNNKTTISLRLTPPKNSQTAGIHLAEDYEV